MMLDSSCYAMQFSWKGLFFSNFNSIACKLFPGFEFRNLIAIQIPWNWPSSHFCFKIGPNNIIRNSFPEFPFQNKSLRLVNCLTAAHSVSFFDFHSLPVLSLRSLFSGSHFKYTSTSKVCNHRPPLHPFIATRCKAFFPRISIILSSTFSILFPPTNVGFFHTSYCVLYKHDSCRLPADFISHLLHGCRNCLFDPCKILLTLLLMYFGPNFLDDLFYSRSTIILDLLLCLLFSFFPDIEVGIHLFRHTECRLGKRLMTEYSWEIQAVDLTFSCCMSFE
jgi:hypothetical protein